MAERIKMSLVERAKQFAPFDALNGFQRELEKIRRTHLASFGEQNQVKHPSHCSHLLNRN